MEPLTKFLTWWNFATTIILYLGSLVFYRLFLHPLAKFPGPRLAAITRYYEAYYDVIQNGQYTFKIAELHKKYGKFQLIILQSRNIHLICKGPTIRISPHELHIIDPTFFEKLYRQEGRWDKYAWSLDAFSANGAMICTANHDVHRARRQLLRSYFSKAKVASQQHLIRRNVEKLCGRISQFTVSKTKINLGAATSAFTRDVTTEYVLGRNIHSLDLEDFDAGMTAVLQGSGRIWRAAKHITWFGPALKSLPVDWVMKVADEATKAFFTYLKVSNLPVICSFRPILNLAGDYKRYQRTFGSRELADGRCSANDRSRDRDQPPAHRQGFPPHFRRGSHRNWCRFRNSRQHPPLNLLPRLQQPSDPPTASNRTRSVWPWKHSRTEDIGAAALPNCSHHGRSTYESFDCYTQCADCS